MKKLMYASMLAVSGALIVSGCTKENVVPATNESVQSELTTPVTNTKDADATEVFFQLDGGDELVEMDGIEWTDETHFFYDYAGRNLVFTSDDKLLDWANADASRKMIVEKYNYYTEQQEFARANGYWDDEEATARYTERLMAEAGDKYDRITLSILFDNTSYGGSLRPIIISYPTLLGFNNRAESMWMPINVGAMCDRTWYRGAKFWYFAIPAGGLPTFLGFNNRAESIF